MSAPIPASTLVRTDCIYNDPCFHLSSTSGWAVCLTNSPLSTQHPSSKTLYGATVLSTVLHGCLFAYTYLQLVLVLRYGHKRFCYRTALLLCCVLWAALRMVLFLWYWDANQWHRRHASSEGPDAEWDASVISWTSQGIYWLFYGLPVCLQFFALCILVCYFTQVVFKSRENYNRHDWRKIARKYLCLLCAIIFLVVSVVTAQQVKSSPQGYTSCSPNSTEPENPHAFLSDVIAVRVAVTGTLFLGMAIALCYSIIRLTKRTNSARLILETEGLTLCSAVAIGISIVLLYVFRYTYNILALIPCFYWIYDTDQLEFLCDRNYSYLSFAVIIFLFEYIPTLFMVVFFRAKPVTGTSESGSIIPQNPLDLLSETEDEVTVIEPRYSMYGSLETTLPRSCSVNTLGRTHCLGNDSGRDTISSGYGTPASSTGFLLPQGSLLGSVRFHEAK